MRSRLFALIAAGALLASACGASATPSPSARTPVPPTVAPPSAAPTATPQPTTYPTGVAYVVTVRVKPGTTWSDGSPFGAADYVGTYNLLWAQQDPTWESLIDVVKLDELTFQFWLKDVSARRLWQLIQYNTPGSVAQFGTFFERAKALREKGEKPDGEAAQALITELNAFRPANIVSYGPFRIDPASVTEAQLELVKNPGGFHANLIDFDRVVIYWGDSQQAVPLILSNQLDYTTSSLTPADETAVAANDHLQIIRGPLGVGPAIWFNEAIAPFAKKEFRQAMAYLIDRQQVATVSLGNSGKPIEAMAGFSDLLVDQWLTPETKSQLNPYPHDPAKAEELLRSIGWQKVDGAWQDETGKAVSYELKVPSDFVDFLATGQEVAQELNTFGIKTSVRGIAAADRPTTIKDANYQILIDFGLISTPTHPHASMSYYMTEGFFGSNNPDATSGSKGMDWPLVQTVPGSGEQVDIRELLDASQAGLDLDAQKVPVQKLSLIFNDQLPIVPLYERFTNEPINVVDRVTGWRPLNDPIYMNNQGTSNYIAQQMLAGELKVSPSGDGTFRTNVPYIQPPNLSYNLFDYSTSLLSTFNSPSFDFVLPPLFFFSQPEGKWVPSEAGVGESFDVLQVK